MVIGWRPPGKRSPRLMRRFILKAAGAGAVAATLLCGCGAPPRAVATPALPRVLLRPERAGTAGGAAVIGVLFAGWHTGLILPVRELGPLHSVLPVRPGERYVSFGWGNRRFYMSPSPSLAEALAALFRSASTVLVEGAPTAEDLLPSAGTYRWLCADREEVLRLDAYLLESLRERGGKPIVLGTGPISNSEFLASGERYDALHTCNTWTAAALQHAGFAIHAAGVIFSSQLQARVRNLSFCRRAPRDAAAAARLRPAAPPSALLSLARPEPVARSAHPPARAGS